MGLGYVLCSSMMMVVNKLALRAFPYPSSLMALQFLVSAVVVRGLGVLGQLECAPLERERVRAFWIVPLVFEVAIFTNMKMLQAASVETVIVFRTLVPLITSWADAAFMGREAPSTRSALSLLAIVLSALGYAGTSSGGLRVDVWMWAISYLLVLAFEMVYVKHVLNELPMSTWTRVYYNNALALLFCPPFFVIGGGEYARLADALAALQQAAPAGLVALSCVFGIGISFTGFGFRNLVTATSFTVVGVMNKVLTVLASMLLFNNTATPLGVCALLACIGAGTMYRQAPPRAPPPVDDDPTDQEELQEVAPRK